MYWRLIDTGVGSAAWNMAVDEVLLGHFGEGDKPILRLYGWEEALSLGRFSCVSDILRIVEDPLPLVRRPTGGGVLVHGGDLSYTLVLGREWVLQRGVKESYRILCGFLIRLYEKLGYPAVFAADVHCKEIKSGVCLAGVEGYDILIGGKKMGGNAQRHTAHALLQHGSIPVFINHARFEPLFRGENGLADAATLERLGGNIGFSELSALLVEAFRETMGAEMFTDTLSSAEQKGAEALALSKYTQERWNIDGIHP